LNTADRHFAPSSNSAVRQDTPFRHRLATGDFSHPPALICGVYPARGGFLPFQGGVSPRFTPSQISKTPHLTASDRVKPHNKFFFVQPSPAHPVSPVHNSFPVRVFRVFRGSIPHSALRTPHSALECLARFRCSALRTPHWNVSPVSGVPHSALRTGMSRPFRVFRTPHSALRTGMFHHPNPCASRPLKGVPPCSAIFRHHFLPRLGLPISGFSISAFGLFSTPAPTIFGCLRLFSPILGFLFTGRTSRLALPLRRLRGRGPGRGGSIIKSSVQIPVPVVRVFRGSIPHSALLQGQPPAMPVKKPVNAADRTCQN